MNKQIASLTIFLIITLTLSINLSAQSMSDLEKKYSNDSYNFQSAQSRLDSLQKILNDKANQIDIEKRNQPKDEDKIKALMANSILISNQIEALQKKLPDLRNKLELSKKELYEFYSLKVDSLKEIQKSGETNQSKEEIDKQILIFTGKKIIVSPAITSLSFKPEKLINLNLNSIKDQNERSLYKEYLQNALAEIEDKLKSVEKELTETNQIVQLQKRMSRFIDEADFEREIQPAHSVPEKTEQNSWDNSTTGLFDNKDVREQTTNYATILNQISIYQTNEIKNILFSTGRTDFSLKDYQRLLKQVKISLQDYRAILIDKLDSSR